MPGSGRTELHSMSHLIVNLGKELIDWAEIHTYIYSKGCFFTRVKMLLLLLPHFVNHFVELLSFLSLMRKSRRLLKSDIISADIYCQFYFFIYIYIHVCACVYVCVKICVC